MEAIFSTRGPIGRGPFAVRSALILMVGAIVGYGLYKAGYFFLHFKTVGIFWALVAAFVTAVALFVQIIRRAQDIGKPSIWMFVPIYNIYLLGLLLFKEGRTAEQA